MTIEFRRNRSVATAYAVLSHLDLGHDAANLYDRSAPHRPWVARLLAAYRAAPGRLAIQGVGLWWPDELAERLRDEPPPSLRDLPGRELFAAFANAFEDLWRRGAAPKWGPEPDALVDTWSRLRSALWEKKGSAPRWTIFDAPALGRAGRASHTDDEQRIAVAFGQPPDHLVCQVFHEAVHAVTDPIVAPQRDMLRSTTHGTRGFSLHERLEAAAVDVGRAIVEARAPELAPAYEQWCIRVGAVNG